MPAQIIVMCAAVLVIAFLVITYFSRNVVVSSWHEKVIFFVFKLALSFVIVFLALFFGLTTFEQKNIMSATENSKMLVQGMLIMAIALSGLAYINLRTVRRIRQKKK